MRKICSSLFFGLVMVVFPVTMLACGQKVKTEFVAGPAGPMGPSGKNGTDGHNGSNGANGSNGTNGTNGADALLPGLSCNVHDLNSWNSSSRLPEILANNPVVGNFTLANLSVGDSSASAGFPGMPIAIQNAVGLEGYVLDCFGYLKVETSGTHVFKLLSDDGSRLVINNVTVVDNQGLHAPTTVTGSALLYKGYNKFNVLYYQGPYSQIALELKFSGPNTTERVVPAFAFVH